MNTDKRQFAQFLSQNTALLSSLDATSLAEAEGLSAVLLYHLQSNHSPIEPKLQALVKNQLLLHLLQEHAMLEVQSAFTTAGIACLWLKGAALAYTIYPQAHLRLKNDLDCLVRPQDFPHALEILQRLNYYEPDYSLKTVGRERLHHRHLLHQQYPQLIFELHQHLLGLQGQRYIAPEILTEWFTKPLKFQVGSATLATLQPENHFLYLCAHAFLQHGEAYVRLRDLYDMWRLLQHYPLDWEVLLAQAQRLKWRFLLAYALERIQSYFPLSIPADVLAELAQAKADDELSATILLKAQDDTRGEQTLESLAEYTFPERLQKISQMLLPSPSYMRERYAIPANKSTLPYYFFRLYDQSKGLSLSLLRRVQYHFSKKSSSRMNENHPPA